MSDLSHSLVIRSTSLARRPDTRVWPATLLGLLLAGLIALAWAVSGLPLPFDGRPGPGPEVRAILDRAGQEGIYAYDGVSSAASMAAREMFEGTYVMALTEREANARADYLAILPNPSECVRYARALADLNSKVAFCQPVH